MHIYIDETGDTGFKFEKNSSKYFIVTMLLFKDPKDIEKVVNAIKKLSIKLNRSLKDEWKFSKTNKDWKRLFFETISNYEFEVRSVVMVKENLTGNLLITDPDILYRYTCKLLLQYKNSNLNKAKIIFDKCGNRYFYTQLRQYLRNKCNIDHSMIKEFKSIDSHKDIPLQIVDMISGAIGRSFSDKKRKNDYIDIIEKKISNIFKFPNDMNK